jgi:hypothetical protein
MNATMIGMGKLALRQTAESRFSHFAGTQDELLALVEANFDRATPGYRDGVLLVSVAPEGFFSGVVELTANTPLKATFEARREGEAPFVQVVATEGEKLPAKAVEVVLYRRNLLEEGRGSGADWDIISINARPTEEPEPMTPMAMARNMLHLPGGTAATYTAEEFAQAIIYWSTRAMKA